VAAGGGVEGVAGGGAALGGGVAGAAAGAGAPGVAAGGVEAVFEVAHAYHPSAKATNNSA